MDKAEKIEFIGSEMRSGKTLEQVAQALGLSRQRVHQIAKQFGFRRVFEKKVYVPKGTKRGAARKYEAIRSECAAKGLRDPYRAYHFHKANAARRAIAFLLTFEEWWEIWKDQYAERGNTKGCKVMCRYLDKGPYAVGNVRIDTIRGNAVEHALVGKLKKPTGMRLHYGYGMIDIQASSPKRPDHALMDKQAGLADE